MTNRAEQDFFVGDRIAWRNSAEIRRSQGDIEGAQTLLDMGIEFGQGSFIVRGVSTKDGRTIVSFCDENGEMQEVDSRYFERMAGSVRMLTT